MNTPTYRVIDFYVLVEQNYPDVLQKFKEQFPEPLARLSHTKFLNTLDRILNESTTPIYPSFGKTHPCTEEGYFTLNK